MKLALELIEGFVFVLIIGVVLLSGAALMAHTFVDSPEYRPDLTVPPSRIICEQDAGGNCWIKGGVK